MQGSGEQDFDVRASVVVVALHQLQPILENETIWALHRTIQVYGHSLASRSGEDDFLRVPGLVDVAYYRPGRAILFGPYDSASFYVADDLESVAYVASQTGATAQEFVFGQPVAAPDRVHVAALERLFGAPHEDRPIVAISRIKLVDPLMAVAGEALRRAVASHVYRQAADVEGVDVLVLKAWSRVELAVLALGRRVGALHEVFARVEAVRVRDLLDGEPPGSPLRRALVEAPGLDGEKVEHAVPERLLRRWVDGRWAGVAQPARPADLLAKLHQCHPLASVRTQFGLHCGWWARWRARDESRLDAALQVAHLACTMGEAHPATRERPSFQAWRDALGRRLESARAAAAGGGALRVTVRWLPKPGHVDDVVAMVKEIDAAAGRGARERWFTASSGRSTFVGLRLSLADGADGLIALLSIAAWGRNGADRRHVLDVTTEIELPHVETRQSGDPQRGEWAGFRLFQEAQTPLRSSFERARLRTRHIGRVEALALRAFLNAVRHTLAQPEMFGAMIELAGLVDYLNHKVFYSDGAAGGADDHWSLTEGLREFVRYGEQAYQERLQYSPALSGGPPICELPYGFNEMISLVHGVASAVFSMAPPNEPSCERWRALDALVVVFSNDASIQFRGVHDVHVLTANLLQALTPISLAVLFHELGHALERRYLTIAEFHEFAEARRRGGHAMARLALQPEIDDAVEVVGADAEHYALFIEDIFAHAAWRLIGCGGDWGLFSFQFLSVAAMGFRVGSDFRGRTEPLNVWALYLLHLAIQYTLRESKDDLDGIGSALNKAIERLDPTGAELPRDLADAFDELARFAMEEIRAFSQVGADRVPSDRRALVQVLRRVAFVHWTEPMTDLARRVGPGGELRPFLEKLMPGLLALRDRLAEVQRDFIGGDARVARALAAGESPGPPPWSVLEPLEDLERETESGLPNERALLWVREIINASFEQFREVLRAQGEETYGVRRHLMETGDGTHPGGLFTTHLGGLFAVGRQARSSYLRARLACLDALEELAMRVRAGRIGRFFARGRAFPRYRFEDERRYARLRLEGGEVLRLEVRDASPGGLRVKRNGSGSKLMAPSRGARGGDVRQRVQVQVGDDWVPGFVAWVGADGAEAGIGLDEQPSDPTPWPECRKTWPPTWFDASSA